MADLRTIAILEGVFGGIKDAVTTVQESGIKREKLRRERETFNTDSKIKKLQLQKLGQELDPELFEQEKGLQKTKNSLMKSIFDLTEKELNQTEAKARNDIETGTLVAKGVTEGAQGAERTLADLGLELDLGSALGGGSPVKNIKQPTRAEDFENNLRRFQQGEISEDTLKFLHPDKREDITSFSQDIAGEQLIERSPEFEEGGGLAALTSSNIAKLDDKTRTFLGVEKGVESQIKTQDDLDEFIEREKEAKENGIDVKAVYEFFGIGPEELKRRKEDLGIE